MNSKRELKSEKVDSSGLATGCHPESPFENSPHSLTPVTEVCSWYEAFTIYFNTLSVLRLIGMDRVGAVVLEKVGPEKFRTMVEKIHTWPAFTATPKMTKCLYSSFMSLYC